MWRRQEEPKVPPSPQNVVVTPPAAPISNPANTQPAQSNVPQAAPAVTHAPAPKSAVSVVCKGISIRGEVTGDEDLQIDGELSGIVKLAGARVMIGPEGRVTGNIQAREIIVRGALKGNLRASERILMGGTGRWEGDGVSPRLAIEDGATVRGHLEVADAVEKKSAPAPAKVEKPAAVPAPSTNSGNGSIAADGGNVSNPAGTPSAIHAENSAGTNAAGVTNSAKPVPVS